MAYDQNNVFFKILQKEIPCSKVFEDDEVLAFKDIAPQSKTHILVIPKKNTQDLKDFCSTASSTEVGNFFKKVTHVAQKVLGDKGFKVHINVGPDAGQEVMHLHAHILSHHATQNDI